MRKVLSWIIMAPIFALLISFSLSNREILTLHLWPTDFQLSAPVFVVALAGIVLGFLWGAVAVWLSGGAARRRARQNARNAADAQQDAARLRREKAQLEEKLKATKAEPADAGANLPAVADGAPAQQPRIL